jgi:hypothetical protein
MKIGDLVRLCKSQSGIIVEFSKVSHPNRERAKVFWIGGELNGTVHWININFLEVVSEV